MSEENKQPIPFSEAFRILCEGICKMDELSEKEIEELGEGMKLLKEKIGYQLTLEEVKEVVKEVQEAKRPLKEILLEKYSKAKDKLQETKEDFIQNRKQKSRMKKKEKLERLKEELGID